MLLVLFGIVLVTPIGTSIITKVGSFFNFNISNGSESFKKTYFWGTGAGNLPVMINNISGIAGGQLHFWWLEVLFTYGPLIWMLYIYSYIKLLKDNFRGTAQGSFVSRVLVSYMLAYIVGACSSSSVMSLEPTWIAWAFIIGYRVNYESIGL